jgi:hypothetical protein
MQRPVSIVVALVLLCCTSSLAQFEHPDLKSGKKHVQSLVFMPVQVQLTRLGMKGSEPMMEESRQTEQDLTLVIADVLHELGYKLDQTSLGPAALENDADLRYTVDDLQKKFDAELERMNHKAKDVRKGRFTLGDAVARLPAGEGMDALLFVRAKGQVLTGGKKAFGILVAGAKFDTAFMRFGVVDARTGDVLYFARPVVLRNIAKDSEKTSGAIKKSFRNFAKASPGEGTAVKGEP